MPPRPCYAYYYGGLPIKGSRRKGRLKALDDGIAFEVLKREGSEGVDLRIPFSKTERVFLTQDNYYGSDTVLFNLTFRDSNDNSFTLRFAPIALVPRRRIALQKEWFDYLAKAVNAFGSSSPLSTK